MTQGWWRASAHEIAFRFHRNRIAPMFIDLAHDHIRKPLTLFGILR
jgi:hypothetical protein